MKTDFEYFKINGSDIANWKCKKWV